MSRHPRRLRKPADDDCHRPNGRLVANSAGCRSLILIRTCPTAKVATRVPPLASNQKSLRSRDLAIHLPICVRIRGGYPVITAVLVIIVWAVTGPLFHYSDTWQLIINTGTTIVTFLMVFLLQNTQNRDTTAIQLKLDELIRANQNARNGMLCLEDLSEDELLKGKRCGADTLRLRRCCDARRRWMPSPRPSLTMRPLIRLVVRAHASPRMEIITRSERRRRWTLEQKREIVAESWGADLTPTEVARKHGISSGQLYTWRQQLLGLQAPWCRARCRDLPRWN